MAHAPRGKRHREKINEKALVTTAQARWGRSDMAAYLHLENWSNDTGFFEGESEEGEAALRAIWDQRPLAEQEERERVVHEELSKAWAQRRHGVIPALLAERGGASSERAKFRFANAAIDDVERILAANGWGREVKNALGAMHGWTYYELTGAGPRWPALNARLARWAMEVEKAARAAGASAGEIVAVKSLWEDWMGSVLGQSWSPEQAQAAKEMVFAVSDDPEWIGRWAREARSRVGSNDGNSHLPRAFGALSAEAERAERNQFQSGDCHRSDKEQIELAFGYAARAPLRHLRSAVAQLAALEPHDAPAIIRRANALRPGWLRAKDAAPIVWEWLSQNDEWGGAAQWGEWREKAVRELGAALQEGCPEKINWRAPAAKEFSQLWRASPMGRPPNGSESGVYLRIEAKGARLSLPQAFWIQGNAPALAWMAENGAVFGVEDAKDLLGILGDNGLPMEFLGPMSKPLQQMVSAHESEELRALAMRPGGQPRTPGARRTGRL